MLLTTVMLTISAIPRLGATGRFRPSSLCLKAPPQRFDAEASAIVKPVNASPNEIQLRFAWRADDGQAARRFGFGLQLVYSAMEMSPNKEVERIEIRRRGRPLLLCQKGPREVAVEVCAVAPSCWKPYPSFLKCPAMSTKSRRNFRYSFRRS